jgi:serine phosphatase RsbU (regulator of sigma subunit)
LNDFEYETHQYRLAQEEFLCVFSDGITEACNPVQELFGRERLISTLEEMRASAGSKEVMQSIGTSVHSFAAGAEPSDDLTVMVLRWKGIKN